MYAAVPRVTPTPVIACRRRLQEAGVVMVGDCETFGALPTGSIALARPKSKTFTVPSGRI